MQSEPLSMLAAGESRCLDPRFVTVERIAGWMFFSCLFVGGLVAMLVWLIAAWPPGLLYGLGCILFLVLTSLIAWSVHVLPKWSHQTTSWLLDEKGLEIRRGILWKRETTIPRARVQHTDVHQGPLLRHYGLAKLVVHTAGTKEASIELAGLAHADALALRNELIADKGGDSDAV